MKILIQRLEKNMNKYFTPINKNRYNEGIIPMMYALLNEVQTKTNIPKERIVCITLYGSQNYHMDNEYSDIDCECFVFPSMDDIVFGHSLYSQCITTSLGTCHVKDIRAAFNELRKCSPNILECFASSYLLINNDYYQIMFDMCGAHIDDIAQLSLYRLIRGLEGLLNKYYQSIDNNKYLANAYRMILMINKTLQGYKYSETLVPDNAENLIELKYSIKDNEVRRREVSDLVNKLHLKLYNYYQETDPKLNQQILDLINNFEKKLMTKYIKLTF